MICSESLGVSLAGWLGDLFASGVYACGEWGVGVGWRGGFLLVMMILFLRHAEAADAADDFSRLLTARGVAQSVKVGKFIASSGVEPDLLISSPVVRARQTAEAVCANLEGLEMRMGDWLSCGMSPETCFRELEAFQDLALVVLVGHEPDFGEAIAWILGMESSEALHIRKASLTAISVSSFSWGGGRLEFSLPARLM